MDKYLDFIGYDTLKDEIGTWNCNPRGLTSRDQDKILPNFLTECYFDKTVLNEYYQSGKEIPYRLDSDHKDYVVMYLGDIGEQLSYEEQLMWKGKNIPPNSNMGLSKAAFEADYMAKFTDPISPDLTFKRLYGTVNKLWKNKYGWALYLPLKDEDSHRYTNLIIPLYDNQNNFDSESLCLGVLVIDSLNEEKLKDEINFEKGDKGISKFGKFLEKEGFKHDGLIKLLRNIQDLRNGVHKKGDKYKRGFDYFEIKKYGFKNGFIRILQLLNIEFEMLIDWLRL